MSKATQIHNLYKRAQSEAEKGHPESVKGSFDNIRELDPKQKYRQTKLLLNKPKNGLSEEESLYQQASTNAYHTYQDIAVNAVEKVAIDGELSSLTIARVGNGDGLWVDSEGIMCIKQGENFNPCYLIKPLHDKISDDKYTLQLKQIDGDGNETLSRYCRVSQFRPDLFMNKEGTLYNIIISEDGRVDRPEPLGSNNNPTARNNESLQLEAFRTAYRGFDAKALKVAYEHVQNSKIENKEKAIKTIKGILIPKKD